MWGEKNRIYTLRLHNVGFKDDVNIEITFQSLCVECLTRFVRENPHCRQITLWIILDLIGCYMLWLHLNSTIINLWCYFYCFKIWFSFFVTHLN